jgi:membrane associated rhomboid family serine protease
MFVPIGDEPNPRGVPIVNYVLIVINVGVFLLITVPLMSHRPEVYDPFVRRLIEDLVRQYPNVSLEAIARDVLASVSAYDVFLQRWGYRPADPSALAILTSMFLHGGWMHMLGNMLFLWIYGDNVEHRLGKVGYLVAYLITGALAAVGYGLVVPASAGYVPMVGASGAISGILGFYFVWFPRNRVRLLVVLFPFYVGVWRIASRWVLGFFLVVDNLLPFLLKPRGSGGGVAYGAHLGGFLAGLGGALLIDRIAAVLRRGKSVGSARGRAGVARHESSAPTGELADVDAVGWALARDDVLLALRRYLALPRVARRKVPLPLVCDLAERTLATGAADVALAVYGAGLEDHPTGSRLDLVFAGIGEILLHHLHRPAAAYQYLMDALDADPDDAVRERVEIMLREIEELQESP